MKKLHPSAGLEGLQKKQLVKHGVQPVATLQSKPNGPVQVYVNCQEVKVGDADENADCYFVNPGMTMPLGFGEVQAGDVLMWNAQHAGYDLSFNDDIQLAYDEGIDHQVQKVTVQDAKLEKLAGAEDVYLPVFGEPGPVEDLGIEVNEVDLSTIVPGSKVPSAVVPAKQGPKQMDPKLAAKLDPLVDKIVEGEALHAQKVAERVCTKIAYAYPSILSFGPVNDVVSPMISLLTISSYNDGGLAKKIENVKKTFAMAVWDIGSLERVCALAGVAIPDSPGAWGFDAKAVVEVLYLRTELEIHKEKGFEGHPLYLTEQEMQEKISAAQAQAVFKKKSTLSYTPQDFDNVADQISKKIAGVQPMAPDLVKNMVDAMAHLQQQANAKAAEAFMPTAKSPHQLVAESVAPQPFDEKKLGQVMEIDFTEQAKQIDVDTIKSMKEWKDAVLQHTITSAIDEQVGSAIGKYAGKNFTNTTVSMIQQEVAAAVNATVDKLGVKVVINGISVQSDNVGHVTVNVDWKLVDPGKQVTGADVDDKPITAAKFAPEKCTLENVYFEQHAPPPVFKHAHQPGQALATVEDLEDLRKALTYAVIWYVIDEQQVAFDAKAFKLVRAELVELVETHVAPFATHDLQKGKPLAWDALVDAVVTAAHALYAPHTMVDHVAMWHEHWKAFVGPVIKKELVDAIEGASQEVYDSTVIGQTTYHAKVAGGIPSVTCDIHRHPDHDGVKRFTVKMHLVDDHKPYIDTARKGVFEYLKAEHGDAIEVTWKLDDLTEKVNELADVIDPATVPVPKASIFHMPYDVPDPYVNAHHVVEVPCATVAGHFQTVHFDVENVGSFKKDGVKYPVRRYRATVFLHDDHQVAIEDVKALVTKRVYEGFHAEAPADEHYELEILVKWDSGEVTPIDKTLTFNITENQDEAAKEMAKIPQIDVPIVNVNCQHEGSWPNGVNVEVDDDGVAHVLPPKPAEHVKLQFVLDKDGAKPPESFPTGTGNPDPFVPHHHVAYVPNVVTAQDGVDVEVCFDVVCEGVATDEGSLVRLYKATVVMSAPHMPVSIDDVKEAVVARVSEHMTHAPGVSYSLAIEVDWGGGVVKPIDQALTTKEHAKAIGSFVDKVPKNQPVPCASPVNWPTPCPPPVIGATTVPAMNLATGEPTVSPGPGWYIGDDMNWHPPVKKEIDGEWQQAPKLSDAEAAKVVHNLVVTGEAFVDKETGKAIDPADVHKLSDGFKPKGQFGPQPGFIYAPYMPVMTTPSITLEDFKKKQQLGISMMCKASVGPDGKLVQESPMSGSIVQPVLKKIAAYDPLDTDDAAAGYNVANYWFNSKTGDVFVCVSDTFGQAKWERVAGLEPAQLEEAGDGKVILVPTAPKKHYSFGPDVEQHMQQAYLNMGVETSISPEAEKDLVTAMAEEISKEIDKQVVQQLVDAAPPPTVQGLALQANQVDKNGDVYGESVLVKAMKEFHKAMKIPAHLFGKATLT